MFLQSLPIGWGPKLNKKEKGEASRVPAFSPLCFLAVDRCAQMFLTSFTRAMVGCTLTPSLRLLLGQSVVPATVKKLIQQRSRCWQLA